MKISLCITVFNEEKYIARLLNSIVNQTKLPDEVVIVDGGSIDNTLQIIKKYESRIKELKVILKKGNRPVGRNESIKQATGDIIAITDAGCELDKHWLAEITKPFIDSKVSVVSGYYAGKPQNSFQASLVPYVLVMPERLNPSSFLPSTRSMAMRKQVWETLGGFVETYRWNEDYVFAKRLQKKSVVLKFAPKAIVYWFPRETISAGFAMFYAFAKGDAQAGIWRPKVMILLARIFLGLFLFAYGISMHTWFVWSVLLFLGLLYLCWAVWKNYRYVAHPLALVYLPLWQITSDIAVALGTTIGSLQRLTGKLS